jgi:hypothetical protein
MIWQDVKYQIGDLAPGTSFAQTMAPIAEMTIK